MEYTAGVRSHEVMKRMSEMDGWMDGQAFGIAWEWTRSRKKEMLERHVRSVSHMSKSRHVDSLSTLHSVTFMIVIYIDSHFLSASAQESLPKGFPGLRTIKLRSFT